MNLTAVTGDNGKKPDTSSRGQIPEVMLSLTYLKFRVTEWEGAKMESKGNSKQDRKKERQREKAFLSAVLIPKCTHNNQCV